MRCIADDAHWTLAVCRGRWVVVEGPDVWVLHESDELLDGVAPAFVVCQDFCMAGGDDPIFGVPGFFCAKCDHWLLMLVSISEFPSHQHILSS